MTVECRDGYRREFRQEFNWRTGHNDLYICKSCQQEVPATGGGDPASTLAEHNCPARARQIDLF